MTQQSDMSKLDAEHQRMTPEERAIEQRDILDHQVEKMASEIVRLTTALEAAERERDEWKREAELSKWPKDAAAEFHRNKAEVVALRERAAQAEEAARVATALWEGAVEACGALRERVETAREALSTLLVHIPNGTALDRYKHEGYAALARLDQRETE